MSFGERLKAARLQAGISQSQLAGSRFSVSYISHLEAGRRVPTPQVIDYLAGQLGLERSILSGADWGTSPEHRAESTMLAVLAARAMRQHRRHRNEQTLAPATEGIDLAQRLDRPEMWWQLTLILGDALIALGRYPEAAELAEPLSEHPWVMQNDELLTEAHLVSCRAMRFAGRREVAQVHARRALDLTADRPMEHPQRLDSVLAALALNVDPDGILVAELTELVEDRSDPHTAGLGAWTLGNLAFQTGDTMAGLRWHELADTLISPEASFRDWARFARASADERIKAGIDTGVEELLARASDALGVLGNMDELADLIGTQARWLARKDPAAALSSLDRALNGPTPIPDLAAGRLLTLQSQLHRETGDLPAAATAALAAARRLTVAGAREEALEAWELYDSASRAQTPPTGDSTAAGGQTPTG